MRLSNEDEGWKYTSFNPFVSTVPSARAQPNLGCWKELRITRTGNIVCKNFYFAWKNIEAVRCVRFEVALVALPTAFTVFSWALDTKHLSNTFFYAIIWRYLVIKMMPLTSHHTYLGWSYSWFPVLFFRATQPRELSFWRDPNTSQWRILNYKLSDFQAGLKLCLKCQAQSPSPNPHLVDQVPLTACNRILKLRVLTICIPPLSKCRA